MFDLVKENLDLFGGSHWEVFWKIGALKSLIKFLEKYLSLQLEALSNCDNFTVITVLYNNNVLTWDYKNNNKYQVTMS